jgi:hypothetical protein
MDCQTVVPHERDYEYGEHRPALASCAGGGGTDEATPTAPDMTDVDAGTTSEDAGGVVLGSRATQPTLRTLKFNATPNIELRACRRVSTSSRSSSPRKATDRETAALSRNVTRLRYPRRSGISLWPGKGTVRGPIAAHGIIGNPVGLD